MASLVLLNTISPSKLPDLILAGHQVWEALPLSEVLYLCKKHRIDVVVITAEVERGEMIEKGLQGTVFRLTVRRIFENEPASLSLSLGTRGA